MVDGVAEYLRLTHVGEGQGVSPGPRLVEELVIGGRSPAAL